MVVLERCLSQAVINRCRPQADGDIVVPVGGHSVVGTTSLRTDDIDAPQVEAWEVRKLLQQAGEMMPGLLQAKIHSVYTGVRPLLGEGVFTGSARAISRSFRVIDHAEEGVENFLSVVGGKLTIYRHMAEVVTDLICEKEHISKTNLASNPTTRDARFDVIIS
jgi:glycerol-3-phosphate dehydrogenase